MSCSECGQVSEKTICNKCDFWLYHVKEAGSRESVRIGGKHYRLSDPVWDTTHPHHWLGFGGQVFNIRFHDGRAVKTNNLWHQGTIPANFLDRLPDNASFEHPK